MSRVLWLGCGKIGTACIPLLQAQGFEVIAVRRQPPDIEVGALPADARLNWLAADLTHQQAVAGLPTDVSVVIYTPVPQRGQSCAYQLAYIKAMEYLLHHFQRAQQLRRFILVSSTRVYGERAGGWVDEQTELGTVDAAAAAILQAEALLHAKLPNVGTSVRLAGIYGPGRVALLKRLISQSCLQFDPPYYTNRIHQADVAALLCLLVKLAMQQQQLESVYLGVDAEPVAEAELAAWLAAQMGMNLPWVPYSRVGKLQNKRCRNLGLQRLGFEYQYPSYHSGYAQLIPEFMKTL